MKYFNFNKFIRLFEGDRIMKIRNSGIMQILTIAFILIAAISTTAQAGSSCAKGSPVWSVNKINMNLYVTDIPMWYNPPIGPSVNIQISYNTQADVVSNAPFGNKWQFGYGSYLTFDGSGNVTVNMPDGRVDVFTINGTTYNKPFGIFNTLTKIADNSYELKLLDGTVYVYQIPAGTSLTNSYLVSIKDAYNQSLTIGYNTSGQLTTITDATGKAMTLTYTNGLVTRVDDQFSRHADFVYTNGNLTRVTDMGGILAEYDYETNIHNNKVYIKSITNDKGTWTFKIEPDDGLTNTALYPAPDQPMGNFYRITITNPLGSKEEYYYFGPYSWYVSPRDYIEYSNFITNNYKSAVKTKYYLDRSQAKGKISKIEYPEGGYVEYGSFDTNGIAQSITDYHGLDANNSPITHTEHYTYNSNGLITSYTDAKNNTNNALNILYYSNDIDIHTVSNGLGTITYTYNNDTHDVKTITDRLSNLSELSYNSYGQLTKVAEAKGTAVQRTIDLVYDGTSHNLTDIKTGGNTLTHFTYDTIGRAGTKTDATGLMLGYNYNNLDQVTKILYPDTVYNGATPISKFMTINPSPCCTQIIDSITDRAGLTTTYTHDALKRLTNISGPEGNYGYEYDANGNMKKLKDLNRTPAVETTFEYNLDNLVTKKIYTDTKFVKYEYDKAGLLKKFTNARNQTKTYSFDPNHNLLSMTYSDSTPSVTFTYDDYNRVQTRTDGIGLTQYGYNANNRLTSVDGPWTDDTITYQHNGLGDLKTITPQGGQTITYDYDYESADPNIKKIGRLVSIQKGTDSFAYGYLDVNPIIQSLTRPNGSKTEYAYNDPLKRLTDVINKTSSNQVINSFNYTYYSSGSNTDLIQNETITNGEIVDSFVEGTTTYTPNTLNQTTALTNPNRNFVYDDDGNMTTGYTPEGYALTMTYDAENRMKTAEYTDSSSVVHRTEYAYGGNNLIAEMKKYQSGVLQSDIRYVRGRFLPIQERDQNNLLIREYTWGINYGGGIGGLLNLRQSGSDYVYLYDGKGNVNTLIDNLQNIVGNYRYDPFGNVMKKIATIDQPYMFSTKPYDEKLGLSRYEFRNYMPSIGKWTTRDPIGEYADINLYRMVGNNAINWVDILGLAPAGPPPVPVPGGGAGNGWKWNPNPQDKRGGKWGPKNPLPGQSQPSSSWEDPKGDGVGHWDTDDGFGNRERSDEYGNPLTPEEAHGKGKKKCEKKGDNSDDKNKNTSESNSGVSNSESTNAQRDGMRNGIIAGILFLIGLKTAVGLGE